MHESPKFLVRDYEEFRLDIAKVVEEIRRVQGETAESTEQTSETWHDNFMFEDGQRQMNILSKRLNEMQEIFASAVLVTPREDGIAGVGNRVTVVDEASGKEAIYEIGSYRIAVQRPGIVSYVSPLGALLYGARVGDVREGDIGGVGRRFRITKVE